MCEKNFFYYLLVQPIQPTVQPTTYNTCASEISLEVLTVIPQKADSHWLMISKDQG